MSHYSVFASALDIHSGLLSTENNTYVFQFLLFPLIRQTVFSSYITLSSATHEILLTKVFYGILSFLPDLEVAYFSIFLFLQCLF